MKSSAKRFVRTLHLCLGLASGLIIVLVCLTGSILAFEKELEQAWHPARYHVTPAPTAPLSLAQLTAAVQAYKPQAKISSLKIYRDPTRTVEISVAGSPKEGKPQGNAAGERRGQAKGKADGAGPRIFVNPYTGAIAGEVNPRATVFHTVEQLHRGLVAGKAGKLLMGINALVLLFMLATGLVLWWPATRRALSPRLRLKWGSGWKRLNHDWHIVLGFYTSLFLLVMALTGVSMSFDWVGHGINKLTHSPPKRPEPPVSAIPASSTPAFAPDAALALARQQAPTAAYYILQLPTGPRGSLRIAVLPVDAPTENATDEMYLDQYSGQVISHQTYAQRPVGQRIRGLFKPVHTGAILGWPTKLLALVIGLLGATFPITGTLMWLNRRRKNRRKHQVPTAVAVG